MDKDKNLLMEIAKEFDLMANHEINKQAGSNCRNACQGRLSCQV